MPRDRDTGPPPGRGDREREEERELLERFARTRDQGLREELIERFLPLARRLAARYEGRGETLDDLEQVASVGLVKAIDRFDPDRGTRLSSYAVPTILGELRRHFRDRRWPVHVPRDVKEMVPSLNKAVDKLTGQLGHPPSVEEIAQQLNASVEDVLEAMTAASAARPSSLDAPRKLGDEEAMALIEQVGEEEPSYGTVEEVASIEPQLRRLSKRDREVLRLRFEEDMTQSQIAERIGVSQMHISRILRAALKELRPPE